ncbi:MAG TPA: hypothetical protein DCX03_11590 [Bacteroidales bacterium]|nr:hypothetical protein [Bacteroidales bacterium]
MHRFTSFTHLNHNPHFTIKSHTLSLKALMWIGLLLWIVFVAESCKKKEAKFYPNGQLMSEIEMKGDKKHGKAIYYYPNGVIQQEMTYKNGKPDGVSFRFNSMGGLEMEENYQEGLRNGYVRQYVANKKKVMEAFYVNDTLHGDYFEWHENGMPKITGHYFKGLMDGKWEFYDENGYQLGEANFIKGDGIQKSWYPNGQVQRIIQYKNNHKEGKQQEFSIDGKLIREVIYHKDSIIETKQQE